MPRTSRTAPKGSTTCGGSPPPIGPNGSRRLTGVPQAQLIEAARMLGHARTAMVLTVARRRAAVAWRGQRARLHQRRAGTRESRAAVSGYGTLTGQGNGQGGREHGQKADQLPGYRRIDDPAARRECRGGVGDDGTRSPGPASRLTNCSNPPGSRRHTRAVRHWVEPDGVGAECRRGRERFKRARFSRRLPISSSPRPRRSPMWCCRRRSGRRRTAR